MSEKTVKKRKKKEEKEDDKPTDEETAVAKNLRFKLATKSCNFMGRKVEYFTGSKAVDFLLDSKWASGVKDTPVLFTDRESVTKYLDILLGKGFFHRALKVVMKKKETKEKEGKGKDKEGKGKEKEGKGKDKGEAEGKKEKKRKKKDKETHEEVEKEKQKEDDKKKEDDTEEKKSKRKIKLEPTQEQMFLDGSDAYVWVFDPVKPLHYLYGGGLVFGAIAICLFPLWPPWMRVGTYYTSIGGACLVGSVLVIAILRTILFGVIWAATMGKLHWWLFPNLLADVSIIDSFKPLYTSESATNEDEDKGKDKNKDKEKDDADELKKESSKDREENIEHLGSHDLQEDDNLQEGDPLEEEGSLDEQHEEENFEENEDSMDEDKSDSSSSQGTKDFEIVEKEEIAEADE